MQLLDSAREFILREGLSRFTMEALAREAAVSNPLVYKYFDTRLALLQDLLAHESQRFNDEMRRNVAGVGNYQELVRLVVAGNFEQFSSGNIVNILRNQPDVYAAIADKDKKQNSEMARFLVRTLADQYTVDRKQAEQMVVLASGASQAAAAHYNRFGGDKQAMIDAAVTFIFGGIGALLP